MYPAAALKKHPGANPHRGQLGQKGQFFGVVTRTYRDHPSSDFSTLVGPFDASRWVPHQGKQEIARRVRQQMIASAKAALRTDYGRMAAKLGMSSPYGKLSDDLKDEIGKRTGISFIPKTRIATEVVTSDKPIGKVQDSGNPVGKRVTWTSSNVEKIGQITHVVPAGKLPSDVGAKVKDAVTPREEESFVVFAATADGKKATSYWPRASLLKFV